MTDWGSLAQLARLTRAWLLGGLCFATALSASFANPPAPADPSQSTQGAVSSAAPAATEAGLEVLRAGGNAVDAAVATAIALAVVHPAAGNLLGGGFAIVRQGDVTDALDFREIAPSAATRDMYLGPDGQPIEEKSIIGPLAAGVPGSPTGLWELHKRYGRLPWEKVVAPAERFAREGFEVTQRLHGELVRARKLLTRFSETASVWFPNGTPPKVGDRMRLLKLAALLRDFGQNGPDAITRGAAALAIEKTVKKHGGIISQRDLANYSPVWRKAISIKAFGWEIASMPPSSSGGIILAQTLGLLERLRWSSLPEGSAGRSHLMVEAWRRAYADRTLLGDPAFCRATVAQLIDPAWLDKRAKEINPNRSTASISVAALTPVTPEELPQTTHLSVIDGQGNAVSLTTTLNGGFGCGLLVPEIELILNNEMDDFAAAPGKPNMYGLIQGEANSVGAGKRMLSSMTPTIAWRGKEIVVVGSPGGSHIPTSVTLVLLNIIVDGKDPQTAIDQPRFHHQWLPDEISYESGAFDATVMQTLQNLGHRLHLVNQLGEVNVVRRRFDGQLEAAADQRGPGKAGITGPVERTKH